MIFNAKLRKAAVPLKPNAQYSNKSRNKITEKGGWVKRRQKKTGKIEDQEKKEGPKYQGKGLTQLESANRDQIIRKLKWERGQETAKKEEK